MRPFGLRAEVTSFRHGLKMLGHQRLKRWLALLLATGSPNPLARLLNPVAARRGLVLDELARRSGDDWLRSEMFIGGVFSLLDRLLDKSPAAIRRGLYTMKKIEAMAFEESMSFTESQIALFTLTEDAKEGQAAFQQKRKPEWKGQ